MTRILVLLSAFLAVAVAAGQEVRPPKGQTWLVVEIEQRGTLTIQLHTKEAPKTTAHILSLVDGKFYDDQRVFRVERTPRPFLVQIGDPLTKSRSVNDAKIGTGGSGARIPYEHTGFSNVAGAVGLATLQEERDSGDSQFYVVLADSTLLDGKYTVFGKVIRGMDVLQKVEKGDRIVSVRSLATR